MSILLKRCQQEGFHIILDAPPVLPVTDPVILATKVDGVLLVVSAGQTTRESCRSAIQSLAAAGGKILGIVLQKARLTAVPYYIAYAGSKNGVASSQHGSASGAVK